MRGDGGKPCSRRGSGEDLLEGQVEYGDSPDPVFPGLVPGHWTVVAIALEEGTGEEARPHWRERDHGCTAFRVGDRRGSSSVEPPCRFW